MRTMAYVNLFMLKRMGFRIKHRLRKWSSIIVVMMITSIVLCRL